MQTQPGISNRRGVNAQEWLTFFSQKLSIISFLIFDPIYYLLKDSMLSAKNTQQIVFKAKTYDILSQFSFFFLPHVVFKNIYIS